MEKPPTLEQIKKFLPITHKELCQHFPNYNERSLRNLLNAFVEKNELQKKRNYDTHTKKGTPEWIYQEINEEEKPLDYTLVELITIQSDLNNAINFYSQNRFKLSKRTLIAVYLKLGRKLLGDNEN